MLFGVSHDIARQEFTAADKGHVTGTGWPVAE
jgi:hypothetical protein